MFEEEQDNKIYNLIITRGIDQENEYGQFTEKLYSKPDFLWTESMARDYAPFGESFFKNVDVIVVLSGIYNYNQMHIDILIEKAEEFDIPILLVRPYGMEIVPEELEKKAKEAAMEAERKAKAAYAPTPNQSLSIFFRLGESEISDKNEENLKFLAEAIKASKGNEVFTITGYADRQTGTEEYNENLSKERAEAAKKLQNK